MVISPPAAEINFLSPRLKVPFSMVIEPFVEATIWVVNSPPVMQTAPVATMPIFSPGML